MVSVWVSLNFLFRMHLKSHLTGFRFSREPFFTQNVFFSVTHSFFFIVWLVRSWSSFRMGNEVQCQKRVRGRFLTIRIIIRMWEKNDPDAESECGKKKSGIAQAYRGGIFSHCSSQLFCFLAFCHAHVCIRISTCAWTAGVPSHINCVIRGTISLPGYDGYPGVRPTVSYAEYPASF